MHGKDEFPSGYSSVGPQFLLFGTFLPDNENAGISAICIHRDFPFSAPFCNSVTTTTGSFLIRLVLVSNEVWQRTSMMHSVQGLCGHDCTPTSRRSSVPKVARWQVYHSAPSHGRVRLGSNPRSSVCCSSDASGALYPCPRQVAGVAVHSIPSGHHRAACPHAGVLGRRGFPLESAAARVCREAGGRVTTNVRVQDLDLPPRAGADNRRLEVVADGLPLFHGAQLAIDTTMVSPVRMDGSARRQCATTDGAAMAQARVRKEHTYPELAQAHGRARLVVVACEVGGRWSDEALSFLNSLANAKVRNEPEDFKQVVKASWLRRWKALLACAAARAFALSLLERRCAPGCDGPTPSSDEVVRADRYEA